MKELFHVVWADTGERVTDLQEIALKHEWAKDLMYCDMEGFAVGPDGILLLLDECGSHRYPPEGMFKIVWHTEDFDWPALQEMRNTARY